VGTTCDVDLFPRQCHSLTSQPEMLWAPNCAGCFIHGRLFGTSVALDKNISLLKIDTSLYVGSRLDCYGA
jgi:hypothetical protein